MSKPYLTDRPTVRLMARNGSERATRLLAANPDAVAFGIDDDDVQTAFRSVVNAGARLADHWRVEIDTRPA